MNKIAIRFGDNDFGTLFTGLLRVLAEGMANSFEESTLDKTKICWLVNSLSGPLYVTLQNQWEYNGLQHVSAAETTDSDYYKRTKNYLTITEDRILIDDEVDVYLSTLMDGWDNGETFILDLTINPPYIYSV